WEMMDGSVMCRLISGKTRVAPKVKITVPRMELVGSLMAVRLAQKVKDSLQLTFKAVRYFTDSSAVLGMLKGESGGYLEFVGTRVSEIKTKSEPDSEWFWIPTDCNLADMGTRQNVQPQEMTQGTAYQDGMPWMYEPVTSWPVKKTFTAPPPEEMKKDIRQAACNIVREENWIERLARQPQMGRSLEKLQRTVAYVVLIGSRFRKKTESNRLRWEEERGGKEWSERGRPEQDKHKHNRRHTHTKQQHH
ncbi:MAG: hypothetical protein AN484_27365, partial [Aphanizomenon flos-aquae WA102]